MTADDLTDVGGNVLNHMYIATGIKRELVRFDLNYKQKGQDVGIAFLISTIHSSR
jgi:hypothetical protein